MARSNAGTDRSSNDHAQESVSVPMVQHYKGGVGLALDGEIAHVYELAQAWGVMQPESLSLLHLATLLEMGNDPEAGILLQCLREARGLAGTVICALKRRLTGLVNRLDAAALWDLTGRWLHFREEVRLFPLHSSPPL